jgi:small subunit ribosomal protein S20
VEAAVAAGDLENAEEALRTTFSAIDKASKRNIIKQNTAARRKSRLASLVNGLASGAPAKEKPEPEPEASE